jgi:hypothetical protein
MSTTKMKAPNGATDKGLTVQTEYGNYVVASDGSVSPDSRAVSKLLGSGFTIWDSSVPQGDTLVGGVYTMTSADALAGTATIPTGLSTVVSHVTNVAHANGDVVHDYLDTVTGGSITIAVLAGASNYNAITAGDTVRWMALGVL